MWILPPIKRERNFKLKKMKTIDTAKFMDMAATVYICAMLAYLVVLFIIFLIRRIAGCTLISAVSARYHLGSPARKRVFNRTVHDRRHSPFPSIPDSAGNTIWEMGIIAFRVCYIPGEVRQRTTFCI